MMGTNRRRRVIAAEPVSAVALCPGTGPTRNGNVPFGARKPISLPGDDSSPS
jgi:hypothetical protein